MKLTIIGFHKICVSADVISKRNDCSLLSD